MDAFETIAATEDGHAFLMVTDTNTDARRFYRRCGYVEVGRVPGVIRVSPGDDRDSVLMARRLDDHPMVADGRA